MHAAKPPGGRDASGGVGLEPDGRLVHLIPYKDEVQVIIDWKGLVEIARRNGIDAKATLVCQNDEFEFLEDDGSGKSFLKHSIEPANRGEIIGAYSRIRKADGNGGVDYEWMSLEEINAIRRRSQAANAGPWVTDFGEMARKTVLRRHSKRWPLCAEDRTAVEDDDSPEVLSGRVTVTPAEPRRPLFKAAPVQEEEDDIPYTPEPERKPPARRKEPAAAVAVTIEPREETPAGSTAERLKALVEGQAGASFAVLQAALIDLGHTEAAPSWTTYEAVPEAIATKILNSPKGFLRAIESKREELEQEAEA